jgi:DNA replication protein DnaC
LLANFANTRRIAMNDRSQRQQTQVETPRALGEVLEETELTEHLPDGVDVGEASGGPDFRDPTAVAEAAGGCGQCTLDGKRPETGRYCDCTFARKKQIRDMRAIEGRFDTAGVPDRLRGVTLQGLREKAEPEVLQQRAVEALKDILGDGTATDPTYGTEREGLCILGRNGIGKSGLLVILARHVFTSGWVPLWIKYAALVRDGVQAGYGVNHFEDVELSTLRLQAAQRVHTLCLDDLGDPFGQKGDYVETRDRRDILFRILSARHEQNLTTHITANYDSLKQLKAQFDPRISDRVKEMCAVVKMEGPNLREIE